MHPASNAAAAFTACCLRARIADSYPCFDTSASPDDRKSHLPLDGVTVAWTLTSWVEDRQKSQLGSARMFDCRSCPTRFGLLSLTQHF